MNIGTCGSGYNFITSKATCEEAAGALGLAATTAWGNVFSGHPFGCYYKMSTKKLYWSLAGNKVDDDQDRVSLCTKAGICMHMHTCLRMVLAPGLWQQDYHDTLLWSCAVQSSLTLGTEPC